MNTPAPEALLGFAIPVYNRPEFLDSALASIVPQAGPIGAPIFIPDNACGPTHVEVIARWRQRHPNIVHEINDTNIGIDANVDKAIARCPARYVFVLGDDDLILPGFVSAVLDVLRRDQPAHILCAYMYLDNAQRPITGRSVLPAEAAGRTFGAVLVEHGWALGFIGAHIFNRARYTRCAASAMGSYFNHVAKIIAVVQPDDQIPIITTPRVGNRADDETTPTWSGDRLNVLFGLERVMRQSMAGRYAPQDIEAAVFNARRQLGYAQTVRLLYWAALAKASGRADGYWQSLAALVPFEQYRRLRRFPAPLLPLLARLFPLARRLKRYRAKRALIAFSPTPTARDSAA